MGLVSMACCAEHASIAREVGHYAGEHPFDGVCGLPGTLFDFDNDCCTIDDSGSPLAQARSPRRAAA